MKVGKDTTMATQALYFAQQSMDSVLRTQVNPGAPTPDTPAGLSDGLPVPEPSSPPPAAPAMTDREAALEARIQQLEAMMQQMATQSEAMPVGKSDAAAERVRERLRLFHRDRTAGGPAPLR